jgi:DNA modification methylase/ParB-like chromosome segregation protein Spo0J
MLRVALSQITIPENRQRRDFDPKKLAELKDSILRNGLMNPVTVEAADAEGKSVILRAGERRLRCLGELFKEGAQVRHGKDAVTLDTIPVVLYNELTPIQRLEIEIEENCIRTDFTWKERAAAYARLHELRSLQNPGQTITATASEIMGKEAVGGQQTRVSDALIIAKHLDNPLVAGAKSEKEALRVIRRQAEAVHQAKLAKAIDPTKTQHKLLKGEAKELMPLLLDGLFDCVLTDPPYGVGADNFGDQSATGHEYEDSYTYWKELMSWLPEQLFRVTKERAHCYIFCDPRRFEELATLMVLANWRVWPTPLIWDKGNGMLPQPDHGPRRTYEAILYALKGDRPTIVVKNDVIRVNPVRDLRHGAQKPVALYRDLLSRSCRPGDSVLDSFGGTGPILVAANMARLTATYIERGEDAYNIALTRAATKEIDDGAIERDGLEDIPF